MESGRHFTRKLLYNIIFGPCDDKPDFIHSNLCDTFQLLEIKVNEE